MVNAKYHVVFMVVNLFSDWKTPIAFFPNTTINYFVLFNLFGKCVEEFENYFKNRTGKHACDGA